MRGVPGSNPLCPLPVLPHEVRTVPYKATVYFVYSQEPNLVFAQNCGFHKRVAVDIFFHSPAFKFLMVLSSTTFLDLPYFFIVFFPETIFSWNLCHKYSVIENSLKIAVIAVDVS